MQHQTHQMQLTSLYCYFGNWNEEKFNSKFRQEIKRKIILLLRRNELADKKEYDPPIITEDERRICTVGHKMSIAWKLSRNSLMRHIG